MSSDLYTTYLRDKRQKDAQGNGVVGKVKELCCSFA